MTEKIFRDIPRSSTCWIALKPLKNKYFLLLIFSPLYLFLCTICFFFSFRYPKTSLYHRTNTLRSISTIRRRVRWCDWNSRPSAATLCTVRRVTRRYSASGNRPPPAPSPACPSSATRISSTRTSCTRRWTCRRRPVPIPPSIPLTASSVRRTRVRWRRGTSHWRRTWAGTTATRRTPAVTVAAACRCPFRPPSSSRLRTVRFRLVVSEKLRFTRAIYKVHEYV